MNTLPAFQPSVVRQAASLRCLWLARDIPFPLDAGDRIYSANLAAALTRAGVMVRYLGYLQTDTAAIPREWVSEWVSVGGVKRNRHTALLSQYPRVAAEHATPAYKELLQRQLQDPWDAIVFDGYGSGWALAQCLAAQPSAVLVYVSHNHEERLWRSMLEAAEGMDTLKRWVVRRNYHKVRDLERALLQRAGLVTTITDEDAHAYVQHNGTRTRQLVLTPGYNGPTRASRVMSQDTPRRVVMVGSFRWLMKQENLRRLVTIADPIFAQHGIILDVIGDVPRPLLDQLQPHLRATRLHGFVADVLPYFDRARLALVPEVVGGGFKLKLLDYFFGRVPVAALTPAVAGLPEELRNCLLLCADLEELTQTVVAQIDRVDALNRLQERAYQCAAPLYRWDDRGHELADALQQLRGAR